MSATSFLLTCDKKTEKSLVRSICHPIQKIKVCNYWINVLKQKIAFDFFESGLSE